MSWIQKGVNFLLRFGDRVLAIAMALLFCQLPTFIQQYTQRLGGHLEELIYFISKWVELAKVANLSLDQYVGKFSQNPDLDVARQGILMQETLLRYQNMELAYSALQGASSFDKPFIFFNHLDWIVAKGTWQVFQAGLPSSIEIVAYSILGLIVSSFIAKLFAKLMRTIVVKTFLALRRFWQRDRAVIPK